MNERKNERKQKIRGKIKESSLFQGKDKASLKARNRVRRGGRIAEDGEATTSLSGQINCKQSRETAEARKRQRLHSCTYTSR